AVHEVVVCERGALEELERTPGEDRRGPGGRRRCRREGGPPCRAERRAQPLAPAEQRIAGTEELLGALERVEGDGVLPQSGPHAVGHERGQAAEWCHGATLRRGCSTGRRRSAAVHRTRTCTPGRVAHGCAMWPWRRHRR